MKTRRKLRGLDFYTLRRYKLARRIKSKISFSLKNLKYLKRKYKRTMNIFPYSNLKKFKLKRKKKQYI